MHINHDDFEKVFIQVTVFSFFTLYLCLLMWLNVIFDGICIVVYSGVCHKRDLTVL